MYTLLTAKPKWIYTLNLKVNVKVTKSPFSKLLKNMGFQLIWANFWLNIADADEKINNMVKEDNVSTIYSKAKLNQELYPKVKVTSSLFSKNEEN